MCVRAKNRAGKCFCYQEALCPSSSLDPMSLELSRISVILFVDTVAFRHGVCSERLLGGSSGSSDPVAN